MDLGFIQTALQHVANVVNRVRTVTNYYQDKSLVEATKLTRVEPLTIVSKDLLNFDILPDVNSSLLNMFTAYWLQAVAVLTKVKDVEVIKILDKLNPDRDSTGWLLSESLSQESIATMVASNYKHSLPIRGVAMEADDTKSLLQDVSNLSVGKLINVKISTDGADGKPVDVSFPVNIRLMASVVPVGTIRGLLAKTTADLSIVERYHAWRGGRIEFIRDLIFAQDLIQEQKKNAIEDETGTAEEIQRRVANAKKFGLLTHNPSLVSASNLFVLSEEAAREVEGKLGGKLSNPRIRDKAFENTYAMIICVVDREWERVYFYARGVSAAMDLSFKEIKKAAADKGMNIADVLKAFQLGAPAF